jgi:hypothetical protein
VNLALLTLRFVEFSFSVDLTLLDCSFPTLFGFVHLPVFLIPLLPNDSEHHRHFSAAHPAREPEFQSPQARISRLWLSLLVLPGEKSPPPRLSLTLS